MGALACACVSVHTNAIAKHTMLVIGNQEKKSQVPLLLNAWLPGVFKRWYLFKERLLEPGWVSLQMREST